MEEYRIKRRQYRICALCENRKEEFSKEEEEKIRKINTEAEVWRYKYGKEEKDQHLYRLITEEEW